MLQTQNPYSRERIDALTSTLAGMDPRERQQYAAQHKNDPAVIAVALNVSNILNAAERNKAMQAASMPMPKVVDQNIADMALPEDQGIGQLAAPNIQNMADGGIAGYGDDQGMAQGGMFDFAQRSEPVIRMAGGGYIPSFSKTGSVNAAFEDALQNTLKYEGGYVADDAGKGPSNFGINKTANPDVDIKGLTKDKARELYKKRYWDVIGGDALAAKNPALAKVAFDTAVNLGPEKAKSIIAQAKDDPAQILKLRQAHYNDLLETNPNKFGKFEKSWNNRMADLATKIIPSAEAGTLPKQTAAPAQQPAAPADTSAAAQIPGQSYTAPASNYDQTNSFFGRMADKMGIPLEAQRQISTTLSAPTPLAPVVGSTKSSSGLAALGEKLGEKMGLLKGPTGSMSKAEIAALKNEQAGLRALENSQMAIKEAQGAGATLEEQEYLRKMMEANRARQAPSAAEKISEASLLREGQDVATAQRLSQAGQQTQAAGRTDALADRLLPSGQSPSAATAYDPNKMEPVRYDEFGMPDIGSDALDMSKKELDDLTKKTKAATPAEARKGLTNDDYLMMGLSLLASKSPNLSTAIGEAGVATLGAKREREKAEGDAEYKKAQTRQADAYASYLERGGKEKNLELEAEKVIQDYLESWDKSNKVTNIQDPSARLREEKRIRAQVYASAGLKPIMTGQAAPAASGGFKFVGVNN